MASPACAVHALSYAISADRIPADPAGILAPSATVDDRSPGCLDPL